MAEGHGRGDCSAGPSRTYELTELPADRESDQLHLVYHLKRNSEGEIVKHKARLVARGFSQRPGFDFDEDRLYAPVVRMETLRILLVIAAMFDLEIEQVDIVGAYLNGQLEEEIYMEQPQGFQDGSNLVWLLKLALYGLKQSGQVWNNRIDSFFRKLGFHRLESDPCVYFLQTSEGLLIVAIYVDDMGMLSGSKSMKLWFVAKLREEFDVTDLGSRSRNIIGLNVLRDRKNLSITINQKIYIRSIIKRHAPGLLNTVSTPMDTNVKLTCLDEMGELLPNNHEYQRAMGSLMYAAIATRPDIMFSVTQLSQFSHAPREAHWTAVKHVFRYLAGTEELGIHLRWPRRRIQSPRVL